MNAERAIRLEDSWKQRLLPEFEQAYMQALREFLREEKRQGKQIYPRGEQIFHALNSTPFDQLRVVILGQDPYHGPGQAHGLCFSVQPGVPLPPSLRNIYREIESDLGINMGSSGCLQSWADQGVLLLNTVLTVEAGRAASHRGKGWEVFTDRIIEYINAERERVVFLLWGSQARSKTNMIDAQRHLVLQSPHPSPLSAHRGFFGNRHFSTANRYLQQHGQAAIDWRIS